jgi:glyoxylase-like metal-dependent hydrolase (beta-lactamase superfamily II)
VTSEGVVAFDPLSDSAAIVYGEVIRQHAPGQPLIAIVYSHLHTDHIAGARVLREQFGNDVPIIAHERVLTYFQHYKTPFIDLPTETVTDAGRVYQFGNRTIELRYVGDAHTASILVPVISEIRMAYICDFANNNVVGWKDLPGINIDEMLEMQRRVLDLDVDTVTFCHGPPETLKAVERQLEYFEAVRAKATEALDIGLSEDQATASIDLPEYCHFSNYNDWFKGNVRGIYRWEKSARDE